MKKVIRTTKAPSAIGPYSQAIQVGNIIYTSGQIPIDPATGSFVEGGIKEQTRQSLLNVKAILEEAGLTMGNVVKTTVFMADMNDFADMNAVYAEFALTMDAQNGLKKVYNENINPIEDFYDFVFKRYA